MCKTLVGKKVFNLFIDNLSEFEILGYTFSKVKKYDDIKNSGYSRESIIIEESEQNGEIIKKISNTSEVIGNHVNTFNVTYDFIEEKSIFYTDSTRLSDIILLIRFFLGTYVCLEHEIEIAWNKYTAEPLDNSNLFLRYTKPKIENILMSFDRKKIEDNKLDKLIFFYIEMHKSIYIDIQISILSTILNILVDLWSKNGILDENNKKELESLLEIKERINKDCNYNECEREKIDVALAKYINNFSSDLTTKTVNFVKNTNIISRLEAREGNDKIIEEIAKLINSLRNGIIHSGNLKSHNTEKKFKTVKKETDNSTLEGKIRIYQLTVVIIKNAILELLNVESYYYELQDIKSINEFFEKGTFREELW